MSEINLGESESKFADLAWEKEPILAVELTRLAVEKFRWKPSTAYTVLKRLCDKEIFTNDRGEVTAKISREDFYALRSQTLVENDFCGSLPAFIAAFTKHNSLTRKEAAQIKKLIKDAVEK